MTEEFQSDLPLPGKRGLPSRGDAEEFNPFRKPDPVLRRTPRLPLLLILLGLLGLGFLGLVGAFLTSASKPRGVTMPAPLAGSMPAGVVIDNPPLAKRMIVGVWELVSEKDRGTMEFKADGTMILTTEVRGNSFVRKGKYKFIEDELLEVEVVPAVPADPLTQKLKLSKLTKDELITRDEKGVEDKFKKQ